MEVSAYADFSYRVLMYLALKKDALVQVRIISEAYGISENHTMKVVQKLAKLGYVEAVRGRNGGIFLARPADKINLGQVFREMEPSLKLLECFNLKTNQCPIVKSCELKDTFKQALESFLNVLDQKTLDQVLKKPKELQKILEISPS